METSMLQNMQPIISLTDKLLSLKSNPQTVSKEDVSLLLRFSLDSLTLVAHSVYEVNLIRQELIRPDLNEQYKQQTPISKFLFGTDLPKAVKEISKTTKFSQPVSYPKQGSNNFRLQGSSDLNGQQHFQYLGQSQQRRPPSKFRAHKVAHDQLGSQVSLPFPPSIPCMVGSLKNYVYKWHSITSDQGILDAIRGVTIDFTSKPTQLFVPNQYKFNPFEIKIIDQPIGCFLERVIIEKATPLNGEYISMALY